MQRAKQLWTALATAAVAWLIAAPAWAVLPPYFEDFEAESTCPGTCSGSCVLGPSGWTNLTTDDMDWHIRTGTTSSLSTGPSVDHTLGNTTGKYIYLETSSPCFGGDDIGELISAPLELTGTTNPAFQFWYHMYGQSMGEMHIDVLDDNLNVLALDVIPFLQDNVDLWQQSPIIDLSVYGNQTVHVRFRGISGSDFYSDMAIDDFEFFQVLDDDVGVTAVLGPVSGCDQTTETVTVELSNFGGITQSNFDVQFSVDGGVPVTETFTGSINGLSSASFSFATLGDITGVGSHTITVTTLLPGDQFTANDSITVQLYNGSIVSSFPALDDMETPNTWFSGGTNSSWVRGFPAKGIIQGTQSGANAWVTGGLGTATYNASEVSWVQTLCGYDLTGLTNPAVRLALWHEMDFGDDGVVLQSSIDGGATWQNVGAVGSGFNWYNDTGIDTTLGGQTVGWSGRANDGDGSGGYILAAHDLNGLAGQSNVLLRIILGADTATQDDGFAFDDVEVFDNDNPRIEVESTGPLAALNGVSPGSVDFLVHAFRADVYGGNQDVTSLTLSQIGNIADADILEVKLWLDDGNQQFDPADDVVIDSAMQLSGLTVFNAGTLQLSSLAQQTFFITYTLSGAVPVQTTFGSEIAMTSDIALMSGDPVLFIGGAVSGPTRAIFGKVSTFPWIDDFDLNAAGNRLASFVPGVFFPTATAAGGTVGFGPANTVASLPDAVGTVDVDDGMGGTFPIDPQSNTAQAAISFPNGQSAGAISYYFDLSQFSAATDAVFLSFYWNNANQSDSDFNNVFISVDNGATWETSLFKFPLPVASGWTQETINIAPILDSVGADFSDSVVIRFQAGGSQPLGQDGLLIDDVTLGPAQKFQLERPMGMLIAEGAVDDAGMVGMGPQTLTYTVRNVGAVDLTLNTGSTANALGVTGLMVGAPAVGTVAPGATTSFDVTFTPDGGDFSFDVSFANDDPSLGDGTFDYSVSGVAEMGMGGAGGGGPMGGMGGEAMGGSGTGNTGTGGDGTGNAGTGGDSAGDGGSSDDDGCGCRVVGGTSPNGNVWLFVGLALAAAGLRRRKLS